MYYTATMMGEHCFVQHYNEICSSLLDPARAHCCCCLAASPSRKQWSETCCRLLRSRLARTVAQGAVKPRARRRSRAPGVAEMRRT